MSDLYEVKKVEPIGHSMLRGFLIGMASGLGAVIGGTVVLAALLFLLSQGHIIPFIGDYISQVADYINTHQRTH